MRLLKNNGFTLIEILVAVLILSISLLGMAGLQLVSLQSSNGALSRSQASMLAYDLAERIRRNTTQADFYINKLNDTTVTSPACLSSGCSSQELAREDILQWRTSLQNIQGQAVLARRDRQITLTISWSESQYGNNLANRSYAMTFEL